MSEGHWPWLVVQFVAWGGIFGGLLFIRRWTEQFTIALWHRRQMLSLGLCGDSSVGRLYPALAIVVALLAGGAVPLAPDVRVGGRVLALRLWGGSEAFALLAVALLWASFLLSTFSYGCRASQVAVALVLNALPVALLWPARAIWQHGMRDGTMAWVLRLLSLPLWAACLAPPLPSPRARGGLTWQVQALSGALLVGHLGLGEWRVPVWLGLVATLLKVIGVTGLWTLGWVAFSAPRLPLGEHLTRRVITPPAAIALLISVLWVVVGERL